MTSNVGTRQLKDFGQGIGYNMNTDTGMSSEYSRSVINKALQKTFSPEFLNRVDDVVMFDQLSKEAIFSIIDLELKGLFSRVIEMGYKLELSDEAKSFIAEKGYDVQYGARPLKRAIQRYMEDELADIILSDKVKAGDTILMELDKENEKVKAVISK
jgi:ATP-dependent Clp protease ATP-binding subunit ClpC